MLENSISLGTLQPILQNRPYLPFTSSSLKPTALSFLLNDILINNRKKILELGPGLSTIIMARLAKANTLDLKIHSIEHDENWIIILKDLLERESLMNYVKFIHSPLDLNYTWEEKNYPWYNKSALNELEDNYDLVLIDGPPAFQKTTEYSRIFAFPFLQTKLNDIGYTILLDDISRKGEEVALDYWSLILNAEPRRHYNQFGTITKGTSFNSLPL